MRHSKDRYPSIVRLGLLVVLAVTSLSAQQPASQAPPQAPQPKPSPEDQPPRFRTDANYVRVDVYPTKDGKAVEDLRAEDFELLENGVKQQVQAFERVVISPAGPQSMRVEANSVRGGEQMASNPRNRVFVIFLDIPHVDIASGHHINQPLVRLIDSILGPDDLVAVMTTEMTASQITFGRKTEVIAGMLRDKWYWGVRDSVLDMDQRERDYEQCFPPTAAEAAAGKRVRTGQEMVARRRERMVLDSLRDLVRYLGSVREERKAILTVTQGWVLFRPDSSMTQLRVMDRAGNTEPIPGNEPIGVDPHGKLRVGGENARDGYPASQTICDKDRMYLASIDNDDYFRQILDVANRNNAVVLSNRSARPRSVRCADRAGGAAAHHRRSGDAEQADRDPPHPGREHRWPRGREHQRSESRPAAHRRRFLVLLPARVLLDEHEAGRPVPPHHRARTAPGRRRAGAARVSRGHGRRGQRLARRRRSAHPRSDENGDRRAGEAGRHPAGTAICHSRLAVPPVAVGAGQHRLGRGGAARTGGGVRDRRQRHRSKSAAGPPSPNPPPR